MITELYTYSIYMLLTILLFSLAIDLVLGEFPFQIHPVVWIGKIISFFKGLFGKYDSRWAGLIISVCVIAVSSLIVIVPMSIAKYLIGYNDMMSYLFKLIAILLLTSTFSVKLLLDSARDVEKDLRNNNLKKARQAVSYLVSRDTNELNKEHIISAVIETLSENIPDSYVSTVFYYSIVGIVASLCGIGDFDVVMLAVLAAFIHRVVDTMDSMLGYKTAELINIGFVPAHLDDILNFIPARFSGAIMVISALALHLNWKNALFMMRRDAKNCDSPNSGYTMATVAGALDIQLEKEGVYTLGDPFKKIDVECIEKAVDLARFTIFLTSLFFMFVFMDIILWML